MNKLGKELNFINRIFRDGSGVDYDFIKDMSLYDNKIFELQILSLTHNTYIARDKFNFFVVRIK